MHEFNSAKLLNISALDTPILEHKNRNIIKKIRFIYYFLYSNLYYKHTTRDTLSKFVLGKKLLNKQALSTLFKGYENKLKNFLRVYSSLVYRQSGFFNCFRKRWMSMTSSGNIFCTCTKFHCNTDLCN